ncbi:uncharacterized protein LOC143525417 [Brachyhypopomus gauderio]|uniref:uncharacterized protein LOC143525417 n=1 Tax=Brachyhypopomus gauderio TaxID=698409 RepID=UPI0040412514
MGGCGSSHTDREVSEILHAHPRIRYMKERYGPESLKQFHMWVKKCDFPEEGSFNMNRIAALKRSLIKEQYDGFKVNWEAFDLWEREAKWRDYRLQTQTKYEVQRELQNLQSVKCVADPDLDGCPRRPPTALTAPPNPTDVEPQEPVRRNKPPPARPISPVAMHTRSRDGQDTTAGPSQGRMVHVSESPLSPPPETTKDQVMCPMVEVAGQDGPMLVMRTWTVADLQEVMKQFKLPGDIGGRKFAHELDMFCREFRPTSHELRRLLGLKLGVEVTKIQMDWSVKNIQLVNSEWSHEGNEPYRTMLHELCAAIRDAFPLVMDLTKIAICKQNDSETVQEYLYRLTQVHDAHCGMDKPDRMDNGPITPYEAHLRNAFINGLKPEISEKLKDTCITWETAKMEVIVQHAIHAERRWKTVSAWKQDKEPRQTQLSMVRVMRGDEKGNCAGGKSWREQKRTKKVKNRRRDDDDNACYICGEDGHRARGCPQRQDSGRSKVSRVMVGTDVRRGQLVMS